MLMAGILMLLGSYDLRAQTINEVIISVRTPSGLEQQGVLSMLDNASTPKKLIVVVSGHPGVTRPRINDRSVTPPPNF